MIEELGYSEDATHRRIASMRLLRDLALSEPEKKQVLEQLQSGELKMSALAVAHAAIRREEKNTRQKISTEAKRKLVKDLRGKSFRQAQDQLAQLMPEAAFVAEKVRPLDSERTLLQLVLDQELKALLSQVRDLMGEHSQIEILRKLARFYLSRKDPSRKVRGENTDQETKVPVRVEARAEGENQVQVQAQADEKASTSVNNALRHAAPQVLSGTTPGPKPAAQRVFRQVPLPTRRLVWRRDRGVCTYVDPKTSRRCGSRFDLELDHIRPQALGGSHEPDNVRLRCRAHNTWAALQFFGPRKMSRYVRSMR
jgi:5-methylcytosine-specific restriction endonuclease McrA